MAIELTRPTMTPMMPLTLQQVEIAERLRPGSIVESGLRLVHRTAPRKMKPSDFVWFLRWRITRFVHSALVASVRDEDRVDTLDEVDDVGRSGAAVLVRPPPPPSVVLAIVASPIAPAPPRSLALV
jgi:hypothetical protein